MKPNSNSNSNPNPNTLPTPISNKPNMTSELPMELISDILKRLPIKTLLRFKCVSKPWLSLLTDPIFIKRHLNHNCSNSHTRLILTRYCDTLLSSDVSSDVMQAEELDFPMLRNLSYYVKGHSDGLLCVVANDGEEGKLVVYNPCVGKYRKLPSPAGFRSTREAIGIGFDRNVGDYKVVRVPSNYCRMKVAGYKAKVEVLELKRNVWRQVGNEEDAHYSVEHVFQSTEVNGGLYWLAEDTRTGNGVILRFDLAEEKFKVVAPPREESGRNVSWVGALKDMLCVVHTRKLSEIQIWGTNDDRTWRKIVACSEHPEYPPSGVVCDDWFRYMPLCYNDKGAVLISVRGERLLTFDNRTNKFENVDIRGAESWLQETVYCESLVSPGVGVHPTEAAASSGSAINELTNEDDAEDDWENDIRSSILMMTDLKRELANLLACTVGLSRHTQG